MLHAIARLEQNHRVKIMRVRPRFGPPKYLNDLVINYIYQGQMICELEIKLGFGQLTVLYNSNFTVYQIEKACQSQDEYKVFETYQ